MWRTCHGTPQQTADSATFCDISTRPLLTSQTTLTDFRFAANCSRSLQNLSTSRCQYKARKSIPYLNLCKILKSEIARQTAERLHSRNGLEFGKCRKHKIWQMSPTQTRLHFAQMVGKTSSRNLRNTGSLYFGLCETHFYTPLLDGTLLPTPHALQYRRNLKDEVSKFSASLENL